MSITKDTHEMALLRSQMEDAQYRDEAEFGVSYIAVPPITKAVVPVECAERPSRVLADALLSGTEEGDAMIHEASREELRWLAFFLKGKIQQMEKNSARREVA